LVLGLFWAVLSGDQNTALNVAVFFELLWLDLIPVGTFIPPMSSFATLAGIVVIQRLGATHPMEQAVVMALAVLMGMFGVRLDGMQRHWQNKSYNTLLSWSRRGRSGRFHPGKLVWMSLGQQMLLFGSFFLISAYVLQWFCGRLMPYVPEYDWMNWKVLWLFASLGGVLALRITRAYVMLALCCLVAVLVLGGVPLI
jgi:PTS system mannose-specific IIC component